MNWLATICCSIYYITATFTEIPAIYRAIKRKKSSDYSIPGTWLYLISTVSWSIYIYTSIQNIIVYIGTFVDLVTCIIYTIVIIRYHKE